MSTLAATVCLAAAPHGHQAVPPARFAAVSIEPAAPPSAAVPSPPFQPDGVYANDRVNLISLIAAAYQVANPAVFVLNLPDWAATPFRVYATPPSGFPQLPLAANVAQERLMLQAMLSDRFQLAFHWETRDAPIYVLAIDDNGLKTKLLSAMPHGGRQGSESTRSAAGGEIVARAMPAVSLSRILTNIVQCKVIDQTGLTGFYEFDIHWSPGRGPEADAALIKTLREKLGLRLVAGNGSVRYLVVDSAAMPAYN